MVKREHAGLIILIYTLIPSYIYPIHIDHRHNHNHREDLLHLHSTTASRFTQAENFDDFSSFLEGLTLKFPEEEITEFPDIFPDGSILFIQNLVCDDFSINKIEYSHSNTESNRQASINFGVSGISLRCKFHWEYQAGDEIIPMFATLIPNEGDIFVDLEDVRMILKTVFESGNFLREPPSSGRIESCEMSFVLESIQLSGGFAVEIIDRLANLFLPILPNILENQICVLLQDLGSPLLDEQIETLAQDLNILENERINPLLIESQIPTNEALSLINFRNTNYAPSQILRDIIAESKSTLNRRVDGDIAINSLLRDKVLNCDGMIDLDFNTLKFLVYDTSVYEGDESTPKINVLIKSLRIKGLDTFTKFIPLNTLSKQTHETSFTLDKLDIEVNARVELGSSNPDLPPDVIEFSFPNRVEEINFQASVSDMKTTIAFFAGINQKSFESLRLHSMLHKNCSLSLLTQFNFTQFNFLFEQYEGPQLQGLISPGIDSLAKEILDSLDDMYNMVETIPILARTVGLEMLQNETMKVMNCYSQTNCPRYVRPRQQSFLDFRDLLLNQTSAKKIGGSGSMPYGDVVSSMMDVFNRFLLPDEKSGFPYLNEYLIGPATRLFSNTTGYLNIPIGMNIVLPLGQNEFIIDLVSFEIDNLDSTTFPVEIIQPRPDDPHIFDTQMTIGTGAKPLKASMQISVDVQGADANMKNEMILSIEVKAMTLLASILAKVDEQAFMEFPMNDVTNIYCWAAIIPGPTKRSLENIFEDISYPFLELVEFRLSAEDTLIDFECVSCEIPALSDISQMIDTLRSDGILDLITSELFKVIVNTVQSQEGTSFMNQIISETARKCPHDPMYDPTFNFNIPESLSLDSILNLTQSVPPLSQEILQFAFLSGGVSLQALIALAPQLFSPGTNDVLDPLSGQDTLNDSNEAFLNFQEISVISMINPLLGGLTDDSSRPSGLNLQINVILRTFFLNSDGTLHVPLPPLSTELGGVRFSLVSAKIKGLDTFFMFDALSAIGPQTIQSKVGIESLDLDLTVSINMTLTGKVDTMTLSLKLEDIDIDFAMFLALSQEKIINLQLGSLLNSTSALPCMFSAIHSLKFTNLNVTLGGIGDVVISGFIPSEYEQAISSSSEEIFGKYGEVLVSLLPNFFSSFVRSGINDFIASYAQSSGDCPRFEMSATSFIDFRDLLLNPIVSSERGGSGSEPYGDIIYKVMDFINIFLLSPGENGFPNLNSKVLGPLTRVISSETGIVRYPNMFLNSTYRLSKPGTQGGTLFISKAFDAKVENLNSVGYPIQFLDPVSQNILVDAITLGAGPDFFKVSTQAILEIVSDESYTRNNFDISIKAKDFAVMMSLLINVSSSSFLSLPLYATTNLSCWLALIPPRMLDDFGKVFDNKSLPNAALTNFTFIIEQLVIGVECISCTSPGYAMLNDLLSSPEAISQMTATLMFLQSFVSENPHISNFLQFEIDKYLSNVAQSCPYHPEFSPVQDESSQFKSFEPPRDGSLAKKQLTIALVVVLLIFLVAYGISYINKLGAKRKYSDFVLNLGKVELLNLYEEEMQEEYIDKQLSDTTSSMVQNENIPISVRYGIPVLVFINIGFFLSGHINELAHVAVYIEIAGEVNLVPGFYSFDIATAVRDLWSGPGIVLVLAIIFLSIIWPYTKQLMSLSLWCLSPAAISVRRRGQYFVLLDKFAKWSIFDIFTFIILIAAFSIRIKSRDDSIFLPGGFVDIEIFLKTSWGLYANFIAQVISQLYSHVAIYYHRKIVEVEMKQLQKAQESSLSTIESKNTRSNISDQNQYVTKEHDKQELGSDSLSDKSDDSTFEEEKEEVEALCNHTFAGLGGDEQYHLVRVSPLVNRLVLLYGIGTIIVLITAASVPSFKFEISGVGGIVMAYVADDGTSIAEYSLFGFFPLMRHQMTVINTSTGYAGLISLSLLLLFSTVIAGMVLVGLLLFIWFIPMNKEKRSRFLFYIEIIAAWHYTDVFIVGVFMISSQIGRVSSDMGKEFCPYDDFFASLAHFNIMSEKNARCFFILTDLQAGVYLFLLFSCMIRILNNFVVSASRQNVKDARKLNIHDSDYSNNGEMNSEKTKYKYSKAVDLGALNIEETREQCIRKFDVQFSDKFAWFLQSMQSSDFSVSSSKIKDKSSLDTGNSIDNLDNSL